MQSFWFEHCYFALYSCREAKLSGDMEGIIYNQVYLCIYLFIIYMYKQIIWVDGCYHSPEVTPAVV